MVLLFKIHLHLNLLNVSNYNNPPIAKVNFEDMCEDNSHYEKTCEHILVCISQALI